jgi:hypothetical protein
VDFTAIYNRRRAIREDLASIVTGSSGGRLFLEITKSWRKEVRQMTFGALALFQ